MPDLDPLVVRLQADVSDYDRNLAAAVSASQELSAAMGATARAAASSGQEVARQAAAWGQEIQAQTRVTEAAQAVTAALARETAALTAAATGVQHHSAEIATAVSAAQDLSGALLATAGAAQNSGQAVAGQAAAWLQESQAQARVIETAQGVTGALEREGAALTAAAAQGQTQIATATTAAQAAQTLGAATTATAGSLEASGQALAGNTAAWNQTIQAQNLAAATAQAETAAIERETATILSATAGVNHHTAEIRQTASASQAEAAASRAVSAELAKEAAGHKLVTSEAQAQTAQTKASTAEINRQIAELRLSQMAHKDNDKAAGDHASRLKELGNAVIATGGPVASLGANLMAAAKAGGPLAVALFVATGSVLEFKKSLEDGLQSLEGMEEAGFRLAGALQGDAEAIEQALKAAGKATEKDPFSGMAKGAEAISHMTFKGLSGELADEVLPALVKISAVMGVDLVHASDALGMAVLTGSAKSMAELGIRAKDYKTVGDLVNAVMQKGDQVSAAYSAKVNSLSGKLAELHKASTAAHRELAENFLPQLRAITDWASRAERGLAGLLAQMNAMNSHRQAKEDTQAKLAKLPVFDASSQAGVAVPMAGGRFSKLTWDYREYARGALEMGMSGADILKGLNEHWAGLPKAYYDMVRKALGEMYHQESAAVRSSALTEAAESGTKPGSKATGKGRNAPLPGQRPAAEVHESAAGMTGGESAVRWLQTLIQGQQTDLKLIGQEGFAAERTRIEADYQKALQEIAQHEADARKRVAAAEAKLRGAKPKSQAAHNAAAEVTHERSQLGDLLKLEQTARDNAGQEHLRKLADVNRREEEETTRAAAAIDSIREIGFARERALIENWFAQERESYRRQGKDLFLLASERARRLGEVDAAELSRRSALAGTAAGGGAEGTVATAQALTTSADTTREQMNALTRQAGPPSQGDLTQLVRLQTKLSGVETERHKLEEEAQAEAQGRLLTLAREHQAATISLAGSGTREQIRLVELEQTRRSQILDAQVKARLLTEAQAGQVRQAEAQSAEDKILEIQKKAYAEQLSAVSSFTESLSSLVGEGGALAKRVSQITGLATSGTTALGAAGALPAGMDAATVSAQLGVIGALTGLVATAVDRISATETANKAEDKRVKGFYESLHSLQRGELPLTSPEYYGKRTDITVKTDNERKLETAQKNYDYSVSLLAQAKYNAEVLDATEQLDRWSTAVGNAKRAIEDENRSLQVSAMLMEGTSSGGGQYGRIGAQLAELTARTAGRPMTAEESTRQAALSNQSRQASYITDLAGKLTKNLSSAAGYLGGTGGAQAVLQYGTRELQAGGNLEAITAKVVAEADLNDVSDIAAVREVFSELGNAVSSSQSAYEADTAAIQAHSAEVARQVKETSRSLHTQNEEAKIRLKETTGGLSKVQGDKQIAQIQATEHLHSNLAAIAGEYQQVAGLSVEKVNQMFDAIENEAQVGKTMTEMQTTLHLPDNFAQSIAEAIGLYQTEGKQAEVGSNVDNPLYTHVVNFPQSLSMLAPASALFRSKPSQGLTTVAGSAVPRGSAPGSRPGATWYAV